MPAFHSLAFQSAAFDTTSAAGASVTPTGVRALTAVRAASAVGGAKASPLGIQALSRAIAPAVTAGASVALAGVRAPTAVRTASAAGGAKASPPGIQALSRVGVAQAVGHAAVSLSPGPRGLASVRGPLAQGGSSAILLGVRLTARAGQAQTTAPTTGSNVEDLERALRKGVLDAALGLPIAAPNTSFEKPANGLPWLAFHLLHNPAIAITAGLKGFDRHSGILQIDLNYPLLQGTADVGQKAFQACEFFEEGRLLQYAGTQAMVTSCGSPRDREVEGYYRRSLSIYWFAHIDRPV